MAEQGSSSDVFRREIANDAFSHICDYFDEKGLTLYERWHVCACIEKSALAIMSDHMREACEHFEELTFGTS